MSGSQSALVVLLCLMLASSVRCFFAPSLRLSSSRLGSKAAVPSVRYAPSYATRTRTNGVTGGGGDNAVAVPRVLVAVADGTEEIEAVTTIDTLVRAGACVTVASVMPSLQVTCSRGVLLSATRHMKECTGEDWDLIAVPGGLPGAEHLRDCPSLTSLLKRQQQEGRWVAAICAAPALVLHTHGLLEGRSATCYPADRFTGMLKGYDGSRAVVVDDKVVTSQGPGTSALFALKCAELLCGRDKAEEVAAGMLVSMDGI